MALEGFVRANVTFTGLTGLVCDNIESMIDPLKKEKDALVKKKPHTEADEQQIYMLEWRMALYLSQETGEPVIPAKCTLAAMTQAARSMRLGKHLERGAVQFTQAEVPVTYSGPRDVRGLWEDKNDAGEQRFLFKTIVNLTPTTPTRSMGVRARPIFREWSLTQEMVLMLDMMNREDFENILAITGRSGLCNARRIGYGRFTPSIEYIK